MGRLTEKICPDCETTKPISQFVDLSGTPNSRGKYCISCHERREKEACEAALNQEASKIPKLKIIYGEFWKHYALPDDFSLTLYKKRDFCPYCGSALPPHYVPQNDSSSAFRGRAHIDHMDPLFLGGEDSIRNVIYICDKCNYKKDKSPFLKWLDKLKPKYRKLAREVYIEKHGHEPEEFVEGPANERTTGIDAELEVSEETLRESYPKPCVNGPPSSLVLRIKFPIDGFSEYCDQGPEQ